MSCLSWSQPTASSRFCGFGYCGASYRFVEAMCSAGDICQGHLEIGRRYQGRVAGQFPISGQIGTYGNFAFLFFLKWRRGGQSDVREASLKQHLNFNDVGAHYAGTIQDLATHLEMAETLLVDQLSKIFQAFLLSVLC